MTGPRAPDGLPSEAEREFAVLKSGASGMTGGAMGHDAASIWEACSGKVRGYLRHHLRSAADVDDVLQEVFLRVHRNARRLDGETHLSGWLFTVARSALVDFQRRRRGPLPVPVEEGDGEAELAEHSGIAAGLRELVASLPEGYARAVTLVDLEGLPLKEASEHLGLSLSGAKSRVQRGRRLVRDALLRCCHFVVDRYGTILEAQAACCCCAEEPSPPRTASRR
jgi:RNA polymerase sigma-70 factor (ECF subfamily)